LSAQVVCGEAEPEEVKRVGAVGTWSDINRWVRVDVTSCAKNDLGIWSADSLVSNLIPLRNLANRPAERNSLLKSGIGHIGLVPEWALDAESQSADRVEILLEGEPVVICDIPCHDCLEAIKT